MTSPKASTIDSIEYWIKIAMVLTNRSFNQIRESNKWQWSASNEYNMDIVFLFQFNIYIYMQTYIHYDCNELCWVDLINHFLVKLIDAMDFKVDYFIRIYICHILIYQNIFKMKQYELAHGVRYERIYSLYVNNHISSTIANCQTIQRQSWLTHWGRVTHACVNKLCHYWFV